MVKSYTLKGEQNGKEDRFVAYMLPAQAPPDRDAGAPSTSRRALWCQLGLIGNSASMQRQREYTSKSMCPLFILEFSSAARPRGALQQAVFRVFMFAGCGGVSLPSAATLKGILLLEVCRLVHGSPT